MNICFLVFWFRMGKVWTWCCHGISVLALGVSYAVLVFFFGIVGSTFGTLTGALIGMKNKSGLFHGAAWGAIVGGALVIVAFKASVAFWLSGDTHFSLFVPWNDSQVKHKVAELAQRFLNRVTPLRSEQTKGGASGSGCTEMSCPICLEDFQCEDAAWRLPRCQHLFHRHCIDKWFSRRRSCPLCRNLVIMK